MKTPWCQNMKIRRSWLDFLDRRRLCSGVPTHCSDPIHTRNFAIIAHVDHGKSTLADRLLELTGTVDGGVLRQQKQFLDDMELERERGITIKLRAVQMRYLGKFVLNLIDTPGHSDFHYEVSRSLAAVEGALLVVDATQGVQAQTIANAELAITSGIQLVPVINKIDLPTADPDGTLLQCCDAISVDADRAVYVSAKTGTGVDGVLEAVIKHIPPPLFSPCYPALRALIFDSNYNNFHGVEIYVRVFSGSIQPGDRIIAMSSLATTAQSFEVEMVGVFSPHRRRIDKLTAGSVGFLTAGIKETKRFPVGDTITVIGDGHRGIRTASIPLPGYRSTKPVVFVGLFPQDARQMDKLRHALEKLTLSDSSLVFEPIQSPCFGPGFNVGVLGLLHAEIVRERLEREHNLRVVATAPSVSYQVEHRGERRDISNVADLPKDGSSTILEPFAHCEILCPEAYVGTVLELVASCRAIDQQTRYLLGGASAIVSCTMPLAEVIHDLHGRLKSRTKGYCSMDYVIDKYRATDLVRVDLRLNGESIDGLTVAVHRSQAARRARVIVNKLKGTIPRHQFKVVVQAVVHNRVIVSDYIPALRKDVLAKCYGGDVSRKKKLLAKQVEGKRRLREIGKVLVPDDVFLTILESEEF